MGDAAADYTYALGEGTAFYDLIEKLTGKRKGFFGGLDLKGTTAIYKRKTKFVDAKGNTLN